VKVSADPFATSSAKSNSSVYPPIPFNIPKIPSNIPYFRRHSSIEREICLLLIHFLKKPQYTIADPVVERKVALVQVVRK
jgi:hypothetical protein